MTGNGTYNHRRHNHKQLSLWANVFLGKRPCGQMASGQMSFWANVFWANVLLGKRLLSKCIFGQMSFWANVFLGKCLSGQMSSGQMSSGQMLFWANVFLGKCCLGKCHHGQMSPWANVVWANISGQMSLGKRRMVKCHGTVDYMHGNQTFSFAHSAFNQAHRCAL
jgi:hypothetical protein